MRPLIMRSLLAHSHSLSLSFSFPLFFCLYIFLFSLSWTFMCPTLLFYFFSWTFMCPTLFLSLFFGKAKLTPSLVHMDHVAGCSQISLTLGLLCLTDTKSQGCGVSISKCVSSVENTMCAVCVVPIFSGIVCPSFSQSQPKNG